MSKYYETNDGKLRFFDGKETAQKLSSQFERLSRESGVGTIGRIDSFNGMCILMGLAEGMSIDDIISDAPEKRQMQQTVGNKLIDFLNKHNMLENGIENDEAIKAYGVLCAKAMRQYMKEKMPVFDGPLAADTEMLSRKSAVMESFSINATQVFSNIDKGFEFKKAFEEEIRNCSYKDAVEKSDIPGFLCQAFVNANNKNVNNKNVNNKNAYSIKDQLFKSAKEKVFFDHYGRQVSGKNVEDLGHIVDFSRVRSEILSISNIVENKGKDPSYIENVKSYLDDSKEPKSLVSWEDVENETNRLIKKGKNSEDEAQGTNMRILTDNKIKPYDFNNNNIPEMFEFGENMPDRAALKAKMDNLKRAGVITEEGLRSDYGGTRVLAALVYMHDNKKDFSDIFSNKDLNNKNAAFNKVISAMEAMIPSDKKPADTAPMADILNVSVRQMMNSDIGKCMKKIHEDLTDTLKDEEKAKAEAQATMEAGFMLDSHERFLIGAKQVVSKSGGNAIFNPTTGEITQGGNAKSDIQTELYQRTASHFSQAEREKYAKFVKIIYSNSSEYYAASQNLSRGNKTPEEALQIKLEKIGIQLRLSEGRNIAEWSEEDDKAVKAFTDTGMSYFAGKSSYEVSKIVTGQSGIGSLERKTPIFAKKAKEQIDSGKDLLDESIKRDLKLKATSIAQRSGVNEKDAEDFTKVFVLSGLMELEADKKTASEKFEVLSKGYPAGFIDGITTSAINSIAAIRENRLSKKVKDINVFDLDGAGERISDARFFDVKSKAGSYNATDMFTNMGDFKHLGIPEVRNSLARAYMLMDGGKAMKIEDTYADTPMARKQQLQAGSDLIDAITANHSNNEKNTYYGTLAAKLSNRLLEEKIPAFDVSDKYSMSGPSIKNTLILTKMAGAVHGMFNEPKETLSFTEAYEKIRGEGSFEKEDNALAGISTFGKIFERALGSENSSKDHAVGNLLLNKYARAFSGKNAIEASSGFNADYVKLEMSMLDEKIDAELDKLPDTPSKMAYLNELGNKNANLLLDGEFNKSVREQYSKKTHLIAASEIRPELPFGDELEDDEIDAKAKTLISLSDAQKFDEGQLDCACDCFDEMFDSAYGYSDMEYARGFYFYKVMGNEEVYAGLNGGKKLNTSDLFYIDGRNINDIMQDKYAEKLNNMDPAEIEKLKKTEIMAAVTDGRKHIAICSVNNNEFNQYEVTMTEVKTNLAMLSGHEGLFSRDRNKLAQSAYSDRQTAEKFLNQAKTDASQKIYAQQMKEKQAQEKLKQAQTKLDAQAQTKPDAQAQTKPDAQAQTKPDARKAVHYDGLLAEEEKNDKKKALAEKKAETRKGDLKEKGKEADKETKSKKTENKEK